MGQGGEGSGGILTPVKSVNQFPPNTITMENRESGQFIHSSLDKPETDSVTAHIWD